MFKKIFIRKRGAALTVVMVAVLTTVLLASAVLRFMLSQGRLSRHQINRIRAYYAAQAGMSLAMEMLRTGDWGPSEVHCINMAGTCPGTNEFNDADIYFPVRITIGAVGANPAFARSAPVSIFVDYLPTNVF